MVEMGDAVKRRLAALEDQRPVGMELKRGLLPVGFGARGRLQLVDDLVAAVAIVVVVLLFV